MSDLLSRLLPLLLLWPIVWASLPAAFAQPTANRDKIALVMKALSNPFFFKMEAGAKEYAQKNGIKLEIFGTEMETDIERQTGIIDNLVSRGYGAIVIAPARWIATCSLPSTCHRRPSRGSACRFSTGSRG